jgi:hypothetical protein
MKMIMFASKTSDSRICTGRTAATNPGVRVSQSEPWKPGQQVQVAVPFAPSLTTAVCPITHNCCAVTFVEFIFSHVSPSPSNDLNDHRREFLRKNESEDVRENLKMQEFQTAAKMKKSLRLSNEMGSEKTTSFPRNCLRAAPFDR